MAARVETLFLNELTYELDSQTAWSICALLRKLSDNGQLILCTSHQPYAELFEIFDRLFFLQTGKLLYFGGLGSSTSILIDYFTRFRACILTEGGNPAEWLTASSMEPNPTNDLG